MIASASAILRRVRATMRRRIARGPLVAAALLAVALLGAASSVVADPVDDLLFDLQLVPLEGRTPREFTLPDLAGKFVSLAQFRDSVVMLYFWASW